jgi:hypothetical protein
MFVFGPVSIIYSPVKIVDHFPLFVDVLAKIFALETIRPPPIISAQFPHMGIRRIIAISI